MANNDELFEKVMEIACDAHCRWVNELDEKELAEKCEHCGLAREINVILSQSHG